MSLKDSLDSSVSDYMSSQFVKVSPDSSVASAAQRMKEGKSTEAIVASDDLPIGIVTERDIVYKVVAAGLDPKVARVREIMSAPVETIDEGAKVLDAIAKMTKLGVRRLGVTSAGKVVGLVTQKNLVTGGLHEHVALPELASPGTLSCPYCDATMTDRKELSKHIDQVHLGLGLLEGNLSNW